MISDAISILDAKTEPHRIQFAIRADENGISWASICAHDEIGDYDMDIMSRLFMLKLANVDEWDRLGKVVGRSTTARSLFVGFTHREEGEVGPIDREAFDCIEALYRGLESNTSVENLHMNINLLCPDDRSLPPFNLFGARFKDNLKRLILNGSTNRGTKGTITDNQSIMISALLENMSLESLDLQKIIWLWSDMFNVAAIRRIFLACTMVKALTITHLTTSQCVAVADLLQNPRSALRELILDDLVNEDLLPIITAGLTGNTTLKKLHMQYYRGDMNCIENLLCDTSSIESIVNSNHTLVTIEIGHKWVMPPLIKDCLELNMITNKDKVIRTKIARYYFIDNFNVTPFIYMPVSLLPRVLAMIGGHAVSRQSAMFRLLRNIPEMCVASSGESVTQL